METIMLRHGDHRFTLNKEKETNTFIIGSSINGTSGHIRVTASSFFAFREQVLNDKNTRELLRGANRPFPHQIEFQPLFKNDNLEAFNSEIPSWAIVYDGAEFILMPVAMIREIAVCIEQELIAS